MGTVANKSLILEKAGYAYNFERMVYFNRGTRKVFSIEFVEDHDEHQLQRYLSEKTGGAEWHFYFNSLPPEAVRRELENELG